MDQEELNRKFQMYEGQIMQLQQQLQAVDNAIKELSHVGEGLTGLLGKTEKEIMAPIGRGIYVKAKLLSEKLIVDIGGGKFIQKDISSTKKMIDEQVSKLHEMKVDLENDLDKINKELTETMQDFQENQVDEQKEN